jgi:hypothetical protein
MRVNALKTGMDSIAEDIEIGIAERDSLKVTVNQTLLSGFIMALTALEFGVDGCDRELVRQLLTLARTRREVLRQEWCGANGGK